MAKYDDKLQPAPYAATSWVLVDRSARPDAASTAGLRWQDGVPTTARDVAYTLDAARDPATGYLRSADLTSVDTVLTRDDTTVEIRFRTPQSSFPLVFCELPIAPAHLLDSIPRRISRRAAFNFAPVGNGPFSFVERRAGSRWTFRRNDHFPLALGGPPRVAGLVVAVVDEPTTKFAGLASGELDVAGISPAMASLARRDPSMHVVEYPILFTTGLVFNVHKAPFDDVRVRRRSLSIDRRGSSPPRGRIEFPPPDRSRRKSARDTGVAGGHRSRDSCSMRPVGESQSGTGRGSTACSSSTWSPSGRATTPSSS
jgi:peptide/nickel transport system substrate-binding protein